MLHFRFKSGIISGILFFSILFFSLQHGNLLHIFLVLASLAIHEFTHLLCSELLGYHVEELTFHSLGGSLKIDSSFGINPDVEFIIAAAGPISNLLMVGGVLYLELLGITNPYLKYWLQINLLIGSMNLIPALPLDGGRILHAWFNQCFGLEVSITLSRVSAVIITFLCLAFGSAKFFRQQNGTLFILTGLFILWHIFYFKKPELNLIWKSLQHKKKRFLKKGFMLVKPVLVGQSTLLKKPLQYYGSNEYLLFFLQDKDQKMSIISEDSAWNLLINQGFNATFGKAIQSQSNKTCRILPDEVE